MGIDLNLYKIFYAVGKNLSFTKASKELYLSQPAISKSVKKLEEKLNAKLFEKSGKGIILTEAGKAVYEYAEKICRLDIASNELVKQIKHGQNKVLKIGVPTHLGTFYFPRLIALFNAKHPNVRIQIINKRSEEMLEMLENRELDIVVDTDMINIKNDSLNSFKLLELEGCFICSSRYHRFQSNKIISASNLIKYPLLLPSKTTHNRQLIDRRFQQLGLKVRPLIEVNSSSISKEIISKGIGIGWMIKKFIQENIDSGKLIEIKTDISPVITSIDVAYHKTFISDVTRDFIKILKKYSKEER